MNNDSNEQFILAPASLPQEQLLASDSTITLYHGSAGGGKTYALILSMVKYAAMQNSTIICFRRTAPQIRSPGSVWQEASRIFKQMFPDAKIRSRDLEIYIPSTNSIVKFAHLQYLSDVNNHLGSQYSVVIFDEATTFEPFEEFILPLMGRMRNAAVSYTPVMLWATNPKFDHGIYHWIKDFYLDDNGIPLESKSNLERYFVLKNNSPVWYDNLEDAEREHGKGNPRSFRAIRAHVTQNIPLMRSNPDYIANLRALPEIRRRIYLDGSWTAREEEAGYFKREWCNTVPFPNMMNCRRVRSWDQAATPESSAVPDPDWTRGTLVSKDIKTGSYTVEDIKSMRDRPHKVEELIYDTARSDPPGTIIVLPVDPGQAGIAYANTIKSKLAEMGYYCKLLKTNKSKLTRFLPFSSLSEAGLISFVKAEWNEEAYKELENFNGERNSWHDDIADTLAAAIISLNQGTDIPTMSLSSMNITPSSQPQSFLQTYGQNNRTAFTLPTFNIK